MTDKKKKKRVDLDVRPEFFAPNYDYAEPGLGTGLYRGPMNRYKSVEEFLEKSRKERKKRKKKLVNACFLKNAGDVIPYDVFEQRRKMVSKVDLTEYFSKDLLSGWDVIIYSPTQIVATLPNTAFFAEYITEEDVENRPGMKQFVDTPSVFLSYKHKSNSVNKVLPLKSFIKVIPYLIDTMIDDRQER